MSAGKPTRQEIIAAAGFTGDMTRTEILKRAHADLKWFAGRAIGLLLIADVIGDVASAESLAQTAQARAEEIEKRIAERRAQADEYLADCKRESADAIALAHAEVTRLREQETPALIADAESRAAAIVAAAHERIADMQAQIEAGEKVCAALGEREASLMAGLAKLRERLR